MQEVINGKLYDTSTAEKIGTFKIESESREEHEGERGTFSGYSPSGYTVTTIYRTKKGQYFRIDASSLTSYTSGWLGGREEIETRTSGGYIHLISPEDAYQECRLNGLSDACSRIRKEFPEG
ncbi:MAG: hypothetical protein AAB666_00080 [Patescibacteria group bacterium]